MAIGRKTGGRQKGTPNKGASRALCKALAAKFDPFELLMHFSMGNEKALGWKEPLMTVLPNGNVVAVDRISPQMRLAATMDACTYIYPKLKAIEHSGPDGGPIETKRKLDLSKLSTEELLILEKAIESDQETED